MFLVADFRKERVGEILSLTQSLSGDSPPSGIPGKETARTLTSGSGGGRYDKSPFIAIDVAGALQASSGGADENDAEQSRLVPEVAFALTTRNERNEPTTETLIPIAFNHQAGGSLCPIQPLENMANCLQVGQTQAVAHALTAAGFDASEDGTGRGTPLVPVVFRDNMGGNDGGIYSDGSTPTVCARKMPAVTCNMAVRRLTPKECERLMGWPDLHTDGFSDSVRYRMCGNGIVGTVSEWLGHRIVKSIRMACKEVA